VGVTEKHLTDEGFDNEVGGLERELAEDSTRVTTRVQQIKQEASKDIAEADRLLQECWEEIQADACQIPGAVPAVRRKAWWQFWKSQNLPGSSGAVRS
jgi:hypothetical protein